MWDTWDGSWMFLSCSLQSHIAGTPGLAVLDALHCSSSSCIPRKGSMNICCLDNEQELSQAVSVIPTVRF